MKKRILKLSALFLGAGVSFAGISVTGLAAEVPDAAKVIGTTGFAQCSEYLNVRSSAAKDGEIIGKLYNNGSVEIIDTDENGWYHIRSGNVDGYVAADYIATGDKAAEIAATTGYTTAEVGAETLNVRAEASDASEVVGSASESEELEVVADNGDWVKVVLPDGVYGYVSVEYVYVSTEYPTALTLEEDRKRNAASAARSGTQEQVSETYAAETYETETPAAEEADYGNTYDNNAGITGTSSPDETEAAASEVYAPDAAETEAAQADTEAAYVDNSYTDTSAPADSGTENTVSEDTYTDSPASEDSYVPEDSYTDSSASEDSYVSEDSYTDSSVSEDSYTDDSSSSQDSYTDGTTWESSSDADAVQTGSSSSTGQQIANYACQFVGNPYVWGGTSLTSGADCSGFVLSVFANFGISLPHSAAAQAGYGTEVSYSELQPGDLVFYSDSTGISHVAIYVGGGSIVHAANSSSGICYSNADYDTPVSCRRLV